jgi:xylan 1,4-beta-xylosidase
MIKIKSKCEKKIHNFWNNCIFHPTDAVEDAWGRRIFDRMAEDGSIDTVRIYAMLEDIVYLGEEGELRYDFRLSDLRLDYLLSRGYNLLIAYGGIPDCIASSTEHKSSCSKNKTRYKGKMWNSMPPRDYALFEEVCYEYTKHNIERYGIDVVSKWYLHCFNEPDHISFFLSNLPKQNAMDRLKAYCPLYESFVRGLLRADERLIIGGPALAGSINFLGGFLDYVKEKELRLDYIALHNYGTDPFKLNDGVSALDVEDVIEKHKVYLDVINSHGFSDREVVVDEWGMCTRGFWNVEECPALLAREGEVFSAYYTKLIRRLIDVDPNISKLMICLSGQHEMTEDFTGFRNFFTLNHFAKPIYNAHLMASKLGTYLLEADVQNEDLHVIPTKNEEGKYALMLSYASKNFKEDIPEYTEEVSFEEKLSGRSLRVYLIDKETTNPYRLAERIGAIKDPTDEEKKLLREEGKLKPICDTVYDGEPIKLRMSANATYLIEVE